MNKLQLIPENQLIINKILVVAAFDRAVYIQTIPQAGCEEKNCMLFKGG